MLPVRKIRADSKLNTILATKFHGRSGHVEVGSDNVILPEKFEKHQEEILNFGVRDDDVYILAFPKTGTRWAQELVWLLMNNLDFEKARDVDLIQRSPLIEAEILHENVENYLPKINALKSPRCIGSHLPWSLLPKSLRDGSKQSKMIVVLRGPEDTCVSYYHMSKTMVGYNGSFEEFCELFLGGKVAFGPYWNHVLDSWNQRHKPNVMILKYEDMKADLGGSIRNVAKFLGRSLSDDDVETMCKHLTFDNLKNSKGFNLDWWLKEKASDRTNPFVRRGIVGDHANIMSDEMIAAFKDQRELYLRGTELTLK